MSILLGISLFVFGFLLGDFLGRRVWYVVGKKMSAALIRLSVMGQVQNNPSRGFYDILFDGFDITKKNVSLRDDTKLLDELKIKLGPIV